MADYTNSKSPSILVFVGYRVPGGCYSSFRAVVLRSNASLHLPCTFVARRCCCSCAHIIYTGIIKSVVTGQVLSHSVVGKHPRERNKANQKYHTCISQATYDIGVFLFIRSLHTSDRLRSKSYRSCRSHIGHTDNYRHAYPRQGQLTRISPPLA